MAEARLDHKKLKVRDIVTDYQDGRLVIPEFQRDYVWKKSNAPLLIDSLYKQWPISSSLVWQSDDTGHVEARRAIPKPKYQPTRWLIDGQQRVITLSRLFRGDEGIEVVFNGQTNEFQRPNAATKQDKNWVSVHQIWDRDGYRTLLRDCGETPRGRQLAE